MNRPECPREENIVRAIRSSDWDAEHNRWSSNLFRGPNTSVSRLTILDLDKLFKIFCKDLHKPPVHRVIKCSEINVGVLQDLGKQFCVGKKSQPVTITVEEVPIKNDPVLTDNPAHAEIPQKLPRTLAFEIIKSLKEHEAPECKLGLFNLKKLKQFLRTCCRFSRVS